MSPDASERNGAGHPAGSLPWIVLAAAAVIWAAVLLFIAAKRYGGDIRGLLDLGQGVPHPAALAAAPKAGPDGYDGQFYAALATDPLIRRRETGEALDNPAFRGSRAMIPLLAWTLAAGNPRAAVFAYQLLCWTLGCATVLLAALMLRGDGSPPAWALLLIPGAGLAASLLRTTPDAATLALILSALWFHRRGRFVPALIFAVAAVLSREIALLAALALAVDELRHKRIGRAAVFVAAPAAALVAWKTYLQVWLGSGFSAGEGIFELPLFWAYRKVGEMILGHVPAPAVEILGLLGIAASLAGIVALVSRKTDWSALELTYLGFGALILVLGYTEFQEVWGYARVFIILPFLAVVLAGRQTAPWRRWTLRSVALIQAAIGLLMIAGEIRDALL
jgi:hypothetical protein